MWLERNDGPFCLCVSTNNELSAHHGSRKSGRQPHRTGVWRLGGAFGWGEGRGWGGGGGRVISKVRQMDQQPYPPEMH